MKLLIAATLLASGVAFAPARPPAFGVVTHTKISSSVAFTKACAPGCDCTSCMGLTFHLHKPGCDCIDCLNSAFQASSGCDCGNCASHSPHSSTALFASVADDTEVPDVVASIDDSAADASEAHNVDRPKGDNAAKAKKGNKANKKSIAELTEGQELVGKVKTITAYGAFVDIGYASDGLVHISRISDTFVADVNEILKAGEEVNVRVLGVDVEKKQVALTMRTAEAEANAEAEAAARKEKRGKKPRRSGGDRAAQAASAMALANSGHDDTKFVEGEVASVLDFGAFVRFNTADVMEGLSGELDGLVHISALTKERCEDVSSVVSSGQKVQVRVKAVDADSGKVSLSMIAKEDEQPERPKKQQGGQDRGPRLDDIFAAETMGASDWKESMQKFNDGQATFTNEVVINRK